MAFWQKIPTNPEAHARKQLQALGAAVVQSTKQVDRSYPNSRASARIQREYQRKVAKILAEQRKYEQKRLEAEAKQLHKHLEELGVLCDTFRRGRTF